MKKLVLAAIFAVTFTATAQISDIGREDYKGWKYFANDQVYAQASTLDDYVGWVAFRMDSEEFDPIVYLYVCDLTEGAINRILTFLNINCPECSLMKQLTYMPSGYSVYDAGDLYLAAKLDSGYAVWTGYTDMQGNRAQVTYSVKKDKNLLFVRFVK